ncbi:threonine--tRNA ligase [bacterium]|nr:threonine--tRNA ligase [bacterium]
MNLLLIHSNKLSYKVLEKAFKELKFPKEKEKEIKKSCLVVFFAVTQKDSLKLVQKAADEIKKVAQNLKEKRIVLYPYVHLLFGKKPASLEKAQKLQKALKNLLQKDFEVICVPLGFYKSFEIECKGHPLSELSRVIEVEEEEKIPLALKKEKTLKSNWFIFDPSKKKEYPIKLKGEEIVGFDFSGKENLEKLARYEMKKKRIVEIEPPHISLMKRLEIADYERGSDPGNLKFFPKGRLIKALIEDWVSQNMAEAGAMEVETPIMYDINHPALKKYLDRFPARQYLIETPNKTVFLRFAACFGQFLMASSLPLTYKNLPFSLYELTRYSFRVEQHGELAGLRRLRAFSMPDCHAFCKDLEEAKKEIFKRFEVTKKVQTGLGLDLKSDFEIALRLVKDFYQKNKKFVWEFIEKINKPILVEIWEKRFFYFVFKYEWNFIDALEKAAALSTDQIDVENAKNFEITYLDKDQKRKYPIILHLSPSGAIERVMYALLEKAYLKQKQGKPASFPLWLSPVQVRLCPVSQKYLSFSKKILKILEKEKIRVEVDDRDFTLAKKIRESELDWIPYTLTLGEKEKKENIFAVRIREKRKVEKMKLEKLIEKIKKETKNFPWRALGGSPFLSTKIRFR